MKTCISNFFNFHGCKNDNFKMKNCDVFLIFAQNMECGYSLESKKKKKKLYTPVNHSFTKLK